MSCRGTEPFPSWKDFLLRTGFRSSVLTALAHANAFQSVGLTRSAAHHTGKDWNGVKRLPSLKWMKMNLSSLYQR